MVKWFRRSGQRQLDVWNRLRFATITKKRQRIIALDILRGIFLVALIVNHLPWTPSLYSFVTGRSELFASAAEGFFVVSGALVGYIYGQKIIGSPRDTVKHIWKRALLLYLLSVGGTLVYTLIALNLPQNYVGIEPWHGSTISYFFNTFTLRYSYGWTDFLNRYAVFMLLAPAALWLVAQGRAWIVLGVSFATWLLLGHNPYLLPFSAWQLIFMTGLVIGYYLPAIEGRGLKLPDRRRQRLFRSLLLTALGTYLISIWWAVVLPFVASQLPQPPLWLNEIEQFRLHLMTSWFNKTSLGLGRLLIGTLWITSLYVLIRFLEEKIIYWKLGKFLEYLGRHSLFVYVTHGVLIVVVNVLLAPPAGYRNVLLSTLVVSLVLWVVYQLTLRRDIFDRLVRRTRDRINREDF